MSKSQPTLAGIEEEIRLMRLDADEPPLPGHLPQQYLSIREWVSSRMRDAAQRAQPPK